MITEILQVICIGLYSYILYVDENNMQFFLKQLTAAWGALRNEVLDQHNSEQYKEKMKSEYKFLIFSQ